MRIYEYCERPLHGKVAVIDDDWATVGSSNLDPLSLSLNLEANVIIRDRDFNQHLHERLEHLMHAQLQADRRCEELGRAAAAGSWCAASSPSTSCGAIRAGPPGCRAMCRACAGAAPTGCEPPAPARRKE